jgi:DNA-binding PadR family transcriptional regulator
MNVSCQRRSRKAVKARFVYLVSAPTSLEKAGWLKSRWEEGEPLTLNRPRRRYYRITAQGVRSIRAVVRAGLRDRMSKLLILVAAIGSIGSLFTGLICWQVAVRRAALTRAIIKLAARRLPDEIRARFLEEWQSHVNEVPTDTEKPLVAVGFLFASARLCWHASYTSRLVNLITAFIYRLPLYLSREYDLGKIKRLHAIFTGFMVFLIMAMLAGEVASCSPSSHRGLYTTLSIVACIWIAISTMWAVRYSRKVWPVMLIYDTSLVYAATVFTLAFRHQSVLVYQNWFLCFYWLAAIGVFALGVPKVLKHDFKFHLRRT